MSRRDPTLEASPLGKASAYPERYDPGVLHPIERASPWREYGLAAAPYAGEDLWTAWELSWLGAGGLPRAGVAELRVPCDSPRLVESKSLKLYLASLNEECFASETELGERIAADLGGCAGAAVAASILPVDSPALRAAPPDARCIDAAAEAAELDRLRVDCLLADGRLERREHLVSHLLKSNCPVTGQPDWGSVYIEYEGPAIDHAGLLRYLCSFRRHQAFHEQCTEQIFLDILTRCRPRQLSVYARYLRRGGIDINPWRSTVDRRAPRWRTWRQ